MEENKWNNRMTHLTSFALGVILTTLMISKGWLNVWIWILLFSVITLMVFLVYKWIEGIDYMDTHHKDYKGEDLFGEDEWDNYSDLPNPRAYEKMRKNEE